MDKESIQLKERVKELQCLYGISELMQKREIELPELLRQIVQTIPSAWQYPDSACARIRFEGREFTTNNFSESCWSLKSPIHAAGVSVGTVEVCYLDKKEERDEGPFLAFERKLIDSIAHLLGETIERRKGEDELKRLVRQQAAVSSLGQKALNGSDLPLLFNEASQLAASILDLPICQVLEHIPDKNAFLLRAGAGVNEEDIGRTIINSDTQSQAGYTLMRNEPVIVENVQNEKRFKIRDFKMRHIAAGMSVVIYGSSEPFGVLSVHTLKPRSFTRDELDFLQAVANTLGSAIERDKANRARLEYQTQLRSLASQLSVAEQRERLMIATELHDSVAQNLAIAKMKLSAAGQQSYGETGSRLNEIRLLLDNIIRSVRSLSFDLSPPILKDLGLEAGLEWLVERTEENHGIKFEFEDDGNEKPLDENHRTIVFTMVRELVLNIVKHSKATTAKISIWREGNLLNIEVQDNGIGFVPSKAMSQPNASDGFGLFSIRERLRYFGGRLAIQSSPESGTRVLLTAPLDVKPGFISEKVDA